MARAAFLHALASIQVDTWTQSETARGGTFPATYFPCSSCTVFIRIFSLRSLRCSPCAGRGRMMRRLRPSPMPACFCSRGIIAGRSRNTPPCWKSIRAWPAHSTIAASRGMLWGTFPGRSRSVGRAISLDPKKTEFYRTRATIWRELGKYNEALADLDRLLELDPQNAAETVQRGVVRMEVGDSKRGGGGFHARSGSLAELSKRQR